MFQVPKNVRPLLNYVAIEIQKTPRTKGGIEIPDTAQSGGNVGRVLAVGPGHWDSGKQIPVGVKVGELVMFSHGYDPKAIADQQIAVLSEEQLLCVLPEDY